MPSRILEISDAPAKHRSFLSLAAAGEAGLLILAWGLSRWWNLSPLTWFHPSFISLTWGVAATVPLLLGLMWMLSSGWKPIRSLVQLVLEQLGPWLVRCSVLELAALAAIAGISEEILFRGTLQVGLAQRVGEGWALLAASAAFGLIHFASRAYAVMAAVMGLYLGALFVLQGNLLAPVVTHALYDFVALLGVTRRYRSLAPESSQV